MTPFNNPLAAAVRVCRTSRLAILVAWIGVLVSGRVDAKDFAALEALGPVVLNYQEGDDFTAFADGFAELHRLTIDEEPQVESILLRLLDRPGATMAARARLLSMLELVAGPGSVAPLGRLLTDARLSDPARRVLEDLESPQVNVLLLAAIAETKGNTRIGMISSLGRRRIPEAVPALAVLAGNPDQATARAAIRALGTTGGLDACLALSGLATPPALNTARLDALLQAAETVRRSGTPELAEPFARELTEVENPALVRLGAYELLARMEPAESASIAIDLLLSGEPLLVEGGLQLVPTARPPEATRAFADLLHDPAVPVVALLEALVNRGDIAARGAILSLVNSKNPETRIAAVRALGTLGSIDEVNLLIARLQSPDRQEVRAAAGALSMLPDPAVDEELFRIYCTFEDPPASELPVILARRGLLRAVPIMLQATLRDDPVGRQSLRALAEIAQPSDVPELIALLDLVPEGYRRGVEQATAAAIERSPGQPPSLAPVLGSYQATGLENRISLLRIAGAVGGPDAVTKLSEVASDENAEMRAAVIDIVLTWPRPENLDLRLELAETCTEPTLRARLFRSCIQQVDEWSRWQTDQAIALLKALRPLTVTREDKQLVLESAAEIETMEALEIVQSFMSDPDCGDAATTTAESLARAIEDPDSNH